MTATGITLSRHILEQQILHPEFCGQLWRLLEQISFAAKMLSREIGRAALVGRLGLVGQSNNPTGDSQKKLDVFSNEVMVEVLGQTKLVAAIATEELEHVQFVPGAADAAFVLCMDPLDGSTNTDVNGSLGAIFGVYPRRPGSRLESSEDFHRKGSEQVMAGYVLYSMSTALVYTIGQGVYGFTLDRDIGEFLLSHENVRCPARGSVYSANIGRCNDWPPNVRRYAEYLTERDEATGRPYSLRYTGALVTDLHRCLLEGGLYFYPADPKHKDGKLRLLYECAPLGFLIENAGGAASTGSQRILDIEAASIHQRVPLAIGSTEDVALYDSFFMTGKPQAMAGASRASDSTGGVTLRTRRRSSSS